MSPFLQIYREALLRKAREIAIRRRVSSGDGPELDRIVHHLIHSDDSPRNRHCRAQLTSQRKANAFFKELREAVLHHECAQKLIER